MALFSLPPGSPQSDLDLSLFLGGGHPDTALMPRPLAPEWARQSGIQLPWPHADTDWPYMLPEVTE